MSVPPSVTTPQPLLLAAPPVRLALPPPPSPQEQWVDSVHTAVNGLDTAQANVERALEQSDVVLRHLDETRMHLTHGLAEKGNLVAAWRLAQKSMENAMTAAAALGRDVSVGILLLLDQNLPALRYAPEYIKKLPAEGRERAAGPAAQSAANAALVEHYCGEVEKEAHDAVAHVVQSHHLLSQGPSTQGARQALDTVGRAILRLHQATEETDELQAALLVARHDGRVLEQSPLFDTGHPPTTWSDRLGYIEQVVGDSASHLRQVANHRKAGTPHAQGLKRSWREVRRALHDIHRPGTSRQALLAGLEDMKLELGALRVTVLPTPLAAAEQVLPAWASLREPLHAIEEIPDALQSQDDDRRILVMFRREYHKVHDALGDRFDQVRRGQELAHAGLIDGVELSREMRAIERHIAALERLAKESDPSSKLLEDHRWAMDRLVNSVRLAMPNTGMKGMGSLLENAASFLEQGNHNIGRAASIAHEEGV